MSVLTPMAMSQTKEDLLKHLDLPLEVYNRMAKETDQVYKWLTSEKSHLKKNCKKGKPPYDWSDIKERSKDDAMERIAKSNDEQTRVYWSLAEPVSDCPNWIARWFLYHKFRYRDNRNRNGGTGGRTEERSDHNRRSHPDEEYERGYKREGTSASVDGEVEGNRYYMHSEGPSHHHPQTGSMSSGVHAFNYVADVNAPLHYDHPHSASSDYNTGYTAESHKRSGARGPNEYWDPVRDARNAN